MTTINIYTYDKTDYLDSGAPLTCYTLTEHNHNCRMYEGETGPIGIDQVITETELHGTLSVPDGVKAELSPVDYDGQTYLFIGGEAVCYSALAIIQGAVAFDVKGAKYRTIAEKGATA